LRAPCARQSRIRPPPLCCRERAASFGQHFVEQLGQVIELRFLFERGGDIGADVVGQPSRTARRALARSGRGRLIAILLMVIPAV